MQLSETNELQTMMFEEVQLVNLTPKKPSR